MKKTSSLTGCPSGSMEKHQRSPVCDEFLQTHKIIFTNGAFFTPEGRVTDELPPAGRDF